ncbi:hypothetical protein AREALGSMS7_02241 [Arenibacter algicola]|jgi:hypothetical protein|uniref:Uncharacterized protein n=1 Tax=Arenibacter algicola TaxID=616991 RepID=A0A221UWG9_9FLAO|nr:hypothetical protein AREALGSMS7_02241 [Arenibacter algicola]
MEVNLAYYRKKDWRKFLKLIDDPENMDETWKEWHKSYLKIKRSLTSHGLNVNDIVIDLNELRNYCLTNNHTGSVYKTGPLVQRCGKCWI